MEAAECPAITEGSTSPALHERTLVRKGDHEGICIDVRHEYSVSTAHPDCVDVTIRQAVSSRVEDLDKGEAKYYIQNPSATSAIPSKAIRMFFTSDIIFITEVRHFENSQA